MGEGRSEENIYYQRCKNNDKVPNCGPGRHAFLGLAKFHREVRVSTGALGKRQLPGITEDSWLRLWTEPFPLPERKHPSFYPVSGPQGKVSSPPRL